MNYLIDTDCVVDHLNGVPTTTQLLASLPDSSDGEIAISLITYGEIYEGILYSRRSEQAEAAFLEFLRSATVVPLDEAIMRRFAGIRGSLRRAGRLIPDPDMLIAATALHYDLTLVTRNRRHYERISELRILFDHE